MIRKAISSDIEAISSIYLRIHKAEKEEKTSTGWFDGIYPVRETAVKALERDDMFVGVADGKIVSSAIINKNQVDVYSEGNWEYDAAEAEVLVMHTLTVDPDAFGRGYAREMIDFYTDYAKKTGCNVLRIDTNAKNTKAREMYKHFGFREAGCVPCVFNGIPDVKLILLEKKVK